jgi:O-antigen/teichoic acid export membrane protein
MSRAKIFKNAFASIARGGAVALVAIILPPFLTKILSKDAYNTWLLILQLSTYVNFLDCGMQQGVGRFVAHYTELEDIPKRNGIVSSAIVLLSGLSGIAMVGVVTLAWQLPHLFKDMPSTLHQEAQVSLLIVGGSLAIGLPFSAFAGAFIGLHRYDLPAWAIGISKLVGGAGVVLVANTSHNLIAMAVVMGVANIGAGIWMFLAHKNLADNIQISIKLFSKKLALELGEYCFGMSIWTIGIIMVSGLDTAIISFFDYASLIYYNLAATITNLIVGVQSAIIGSIMPTAAGIGARGNREELGKFLLDSTRYGTIVIILTSLPILFGKWMISLWVGVDFANHVAPILTLLILGNSIRYLAAPYSAIVSSVGEQNLVITAPLVEGAVNLIVSVALVQYLGIIGVAIGTIAGGFVNVWIHFNYNLPRTKSILMPKGQNLWKVIIRPLISTIPAAILMICTSNIKSEMSDIVLFGLSIVASIATIAILFYYELSSLERKLVFTVVEEKWMGICRIK